MKKKVFTGKYQNHLSIFICVCNWLLILLISTVFIVLRSLVISFACVPLKGILFTPSHLKTINIYMYA